MEVCPLSVCMEVCPLSVCMEVCPLSVCMEVCPLSVCIEVCPLSVCMEVCPLSVCMEVCPLSVCMEVSLSDVSLPASPSLSFTVPCQNVFGDAWRWYCECVPSPFSFLSSSFFRNFGGRWQYTCSQIWTWLGKLLPYNPNHNFLILAAFVWEQEFEVSTNQMKVQLYCLMHTGGEMLTWKIMISHIWS